MPQPLRYDCNRDAGGQHQRRLPVPQVVQTDATQSDLVAERMEPISDLAGHQRRTILPGEHETVVVVGTPPGGALGLLAEAVSHQRAQSHGVKVDDAMASALCLGFAELELAMLTVAVRAHDTGAVDLDDLLADDEQLAFEIHIIPAQSARLAPPEAGHGDDFEHRPESVLLRVGEELSELCGLPWLHPWPGCLR